MHAPLSQTKNSSMQKKKKLADACIVSICNNHTYVSNPMLMEVCTCMLFCQSAWTMPTRCRPLCPTPSLMTRFRHRPRSRARRRHLSSFKLWWQGSQPTTSHRRDLWDTLHLSTPTIRRGGSGWWCPRAARPTMVDLENLQLLFK